jgi:hypothetical protein
VQTSQCLKIFSDDAENPSSSLLTNFTRVEGQGTDWGLNSDWMCSARALPGQRSSFTCTEQFLMPYNGTWMLDHNSGFKVAYCLVLNNSRIMDDACALRFSPAILVMVTVLNLFKCFCIACTLYFHWHDRYTISTQRSSAADERHGGNLAQKQNLLHLVTLGDAIASFLDEEDECTKDMDLSTLETYKRGWPSTRHSDLRGRPGYVYWFHAASKLRWFTTLSVSFALKTSTIF